MNLMRSTYVRVIAAVITCGLIAGCFGGSSVRRNSSVVHYLYPNDTNHVETPDIPVLSLPLNVGIAFVPETGGSQVLHGGSFGPVAASPFTESQKMDLMEQIADNFREYPFVKSIEMIPTAYLTPSGSFTNLDQIRTMFGVNVICLLSYDQVQFVDEGLLSLTYWTIIGAYVVKGEKNDTKTMLDAVVFDIPSRKLLFRAPGTSLVKGSATPVNLGEQLRLDSEQGFKEAASDLVVNLKDQLERFKQKVKSHQGDPEVIVVQKPGYTGIGSVGAFGAILALGVGICFLLVRRKK